MARTTCSALPVVKEAEARVLPQRIRELADDEFKEIARLLVSKPDQQIFGPVPEEKDECPSEWHFRPAT